MVLPNGDGDTLAQTNFAAYSNARKDIGRTFGPTHRRRQGRLLRRCPA